MYFRWKYRRTKHLLHMAATKRAVMKLQGAFRRRQARKILLIIRTIRRNKAATKMQCFLRQRLAVHKLKTRKALMQCVVKSTSSPLTPTAETASIALFYELLRAVALTAEFAKAYKLADKLVARYQELAAMEGCPHADRALAFWAATMGVFLSSATYWSKCGPTRQLNFFVLERAMGVLMHYAAAGMVWFPQDENPFLAEHRALQRTYAESFQSSAHSLFDVVDAFYQQANSSSASMLKLFDALVLKADMLMLALWLAPPPRTFSLAPNTIPTMKAAATDLQSSRMVRRAWKMLLKAKGVLSAGSSDQFELKFRLELYSSLTQALEPTHVREFVQALPVTVVTRQQAPNFRPSAGVLPASGLSVSVRVRVHRAGFLVVVAGRLQGDDAAGPEPQILRSRSRSVTKDRERPKPKVFTVSPSVPADKKDALEATAATALAASDVVRPLILFANELEFLAQAHDLFSSKSSRRLNASPVASGSRKPAVDPKKLAAFLLDHLSVVLITQPAGSQVESPWQMALPEVDRRRMGFLESNDARYSAQLIQRVFRGHLGRARFAVIKRNYFIFRRKKWLAWKVMFKWRELRRRLDWNAALIQSRVKGWIWRRRLALMKSKVLFIQCMFRCYHARARVRRERDRRRGGPPVIEMLHGGRTVCVGDRRFFLRVFRCGHNYRLEGIDVLRGAVYHGAVHANAVQRLLDETNAAGGGKLRIWQTEQVAEHLTEHLALVNRVCAGANALGASVRDTDLALIVSPDLRGVFGERPAQSVMPLLARPGNRRPAPRSVNNRGLPTAQRVLPALRGPDCAPGHVKLMRERKRREREERVQNFGR